MGHVRPTGRGVALLLGAVVALLVAGRYELPALLPVTALLLAVVVLGVVTVLVSHRFEIDRSPGRRVLDHGSSGTVHVRVTNQSFLPASDLTWRARLPVALGGPVEGAVPEVGTRGSPNATVTLAVPIVGVGRGRHALGPLVVEVRDPFGVAMRRRHVGDPAAVTVLPRCVPLPRRKALLASGREGGGSSRGARRGSGEDDVVSRSYRPGDPPKRIDWRTTARRGELMVRQDEQLPSDRCAVAIDPGTDEAGSEWVIEAAASILAHLVDQGLDVVSVLPGCPERTLGPGHDTLVDALVDLAMASHRKQEPVGAGATNGRATVVVLGAVDVPRARAWVERLQGSGRVAALVSADNRSGVIEVLRAAGWQLAHWHVTDDVVDRWTSLGQEVGHGSA